MAIPITNALAAYGQTQGVGTVGGIQQRNASDAAMPDFAQLVTESIKDVVETGQKSDQLSFDMVNGKANIVDVVTAISQTELAVESLVTVRDRVISAYEEIMRMPI